MVAPEAHGGSGCGRATAARRIDRSTAGLPTHNRSDTYNNNESKKKRRGGLPPLNH